MHFWDFKLKTQIKRKLGCSVGLVRITVTEQRNHYSAIPLRTSGSSIFMALLQYLQNNTVIQKELKISLLDLIQRSPSDFKSSLRGKLQQIKPVDITQTRKFRSEYLTQILQDCELFSQQPALKLSDFEVCTFPDKYILIKEGDQGDYFYILKSGTCDVYKGKQKINVIEQDQYFGDLALMFDAPRQATVIANGEVVVYRLEKSQLKQ